MFEKPVELSHMNLVASLLAAHIREILLFVQANRA